MRKLRSDWIKFKALNSGACNQGLLGSGIFLTLLAIFFKNFIFGFVVLAIYVIAYFVPRFKSQIAFAWWAIGIVMGRLTSPIILGIFFYLILTPWSFLFRKFNPDSLKLNRQLKTQLQDKRHIYKAADFDNPF